MKNINYSCYDDRLFKGIAHRGLHDEDNTENGLNAFKRAIENNLAFELDVHLTIDKKLVVCHDSDLKRVTNKDGIIEELTLEEIKSNYSLLDGEKLPTLQEVLELNNERVPIVVELKSYNGNHHRLAKEVDKALSVIKNKKTISMISFDPRALLYFAFKKKFTTGLLIGSNRLDILAFRNFFDYLDIDFNIVDNKKIMSFRKKKPINVWTIRNLDQLSKVANKTDMVTFEHIKIEDISKVKEASRRWKE